MEQREYWNGAAAGKNFTTPFQAREFRRAVDENGKILDVGCGYGRTLAELHEAGYTNLVGVDFAAEMIARGKNEYPFLDLRVMEKGKLPFPDQSVDGVILFAVLTCILSDADQAELIAEIRRVLKPNGVLYVNDFLLNEDERNLSRYEKFAEKLGVYGAFELPEGAVCRHHDEGWIKTLLQDFAPLDFERLTFTTMNGNKSNGFFFIGRKK